MSKIKIITDSGSDISVETAKKLGIRILPISYTFDGETYYREEIDMTKAEFYEKLSGKDAPIPKTAQVTPIQFIDAYNEEYDNGFDTLIVVTISSKGSGMYQNAVMSAQEVMDERGGEIIVIDSLGFSCIYGAPVVRAAHMLGEGKEKDEIVSFIKDALESTKTYFVVDDLLHLKKGGRINAATLVLANMLEIKPILDIKGGLVVQDGSLRGSKRLMKKLVNKAKSDGYDLSGRRVFVANTSCPDIAEELKAELSDAFADIKFNEFRVGSVIGCHGGPGLVGFVFSNKYDFDDYEG
ncbi:MAG: DegV family protein [Clostridia bacterium]|nr:DegV family protein [Clostridia bacterium]